MHCRRFIAAPLTRREMLANCANGFGAMALAALLHEPSFGGEAQAAPHAHGFAARPTHFPAKATSVIFLYMDGGVSQVDSFDPKPRLAREHGQPIKMKVPPTQ